MIKEKPQNKYDEFWETLNKISNSSDINSVVCYVLKLIFLKYIDENNIEKVLNDKDKKMYIFFKHPSEENVDNVSDTYSSTIDLMLLIDIAKMINNSNDKGIKLSKLYDYCLEKISDHFGRKVATFVTPKEISLLASELLISNNAQQTEINIYDPVMGAGGSLSTLGYLIDERTKLEVIYYGQEINKDTLDLARMRLIIHGVREDVMYLQNCDSLHVNKTSNKKFDYIIENPPFSMHWDSDESELGNQIENEYGAIPPKTKADFAFLIQGLDQLKEHGTMAICLPHGVLFRGAREGTIRKNLIKKNQIEAIIGLPAGLYNSTAIPTVLLILKKNRKNNDILFIDASNEFKRFKNRNVLRNEDIEKVLRTYEKYADVSHYAHVASIEEVQNNEYNLNIPRYVDTFIEPQELNIPLEEEKIAKMDQEISDNQMQLNQLFSKLENREK